MWMPVTDGHVVDEPSTPPRYDRSSTIQALASLSGQLRQFCRQAQRDDHDDVEFEVWAAHAYTLMHAARACRAQVVTGIETIRIKAGGHPIDRDATPDTTGQ
jgi:hypothetical protein